MQSNCEALVKGAVYGKAEGWRKCLGDPLDANIYVEFKVTSTTRRAGRRAEGS